MAFFAAESALRPSTPQDEANHLRWAHHNGLWRDPREALTLWDGASGAGPDLLKHRVKGDWWGVLEEKAVTLYATREYEHLVVALRCVDGKPEVSYAPLPHPSGLAFDHKRSRLFAASTRNPNQIFEFAPGGQYLPRSDRPSADDRPAMLPRRSWFHPGSLYLHDLAFVGGKLHGNAVGHNAVVRFADDGTYERVWWPRSIEGAGGPDFSRNYLQLNSIAAGRDLRHSFFSASTDRPGRRRPGHLDFPVQGRGVILSGATREPIAGGLTRPHSARLAGGDVWVDNSGYGELGVARGGQFEVVARLPGWTRGLAIVDGVAFVGTSKVIPKFARYAPGLAEEDSRCAIHAVDIRSGQTLGSLVWSSGNQIFAIEPAPADIAPGLPFVVGRKRSMSSLSDLFYAFAHKTSPGVDDDK